MPEDQLLYKGQNVTLDITLKIEHVVRLIAERCGMAFDDAYYSFTKSHAYQALQNTDSLMWAESAEYIADCYFRETQSVSF